MEYRTYPAGTKVKTFTMGDLKAQDLEIEHVVTWLSNSLGGRVGGRVGGRSVWLKPQNLEPGKEVWLDLPAGPAAVWWVNLSLGGATASETASAMRSTVIRMVFDGEETVWCPLGDFLGSGAGLNAVESWYREVKAHAVEGGGLIGESRWIMPYEKSARIGLLNLGKEPYYGDLRARVVDWTWDARSMHFHAAWRQERGIPTRPYRDWNYVTVAGKGVYMGDTLALFNPVNAWWGEGDEKIWVDGEPFPSHFGTGSEDYYGYSYGNPTVFQTPFCNQPRVDGPGNAGRTTNTRTRILDAIPFEKSIKVDMEIWYWKDVKVDYAVTSYWYALPGAASNRTPQPDEAAAPLSKLDLPAARPDARAAFNIPGAIECEKMKVVAKSPDLDVSTQRTQALPRGQWSGGEQLFLRGKKAGDFVELELPASDPGPKKVTIYGTQSYDYGILRFSINGKAATKDYDAYSKEAKAWGPVDLGAFEPKDGKMVLRVEVVGANPESKGTKSYFGLDCVVLSAP